MPSGAASRQTKRMFLDAAPLQPIDRRDRRIGGGEHRVHHDHQPFGDIGGRLEIIFDRFERVGSR